jgi:ATP phosphoribosyltransferase
MMERETANLSDGLVVAVPRGRILAEFAPMLRKVGLKPEPAFDDPGARQLRFACEGSQVTLVRVRSFDVATFVAFGAAHLGVAGNDVLMEFDYAEIYAPLDLGIGRCRLSVAEPADLAEADDPSTWSHIRIATKYPRITRAHFARRGVQAECITLSGAMELAPNLGLCRRFVDLVSTGATLEANGLVEVERIAEVSSRLVVNRAAFKTRSEEIGAWVERFREAVDGA